MTNFLKISCVSAFLLSCVMSLMSSCHSKSENQSEINIDTLNVKAERTIDTEFVSIDAILIRDSLFWIYSDASNQSLLNVCSSDGEILAQGVSYGNGANEILEVSSIHRGLDSDVDIYDSRSGKIISLNLRDSILDLTTICESLRLFDDAIVLSDDATLALPNIGDYSYCIFGSDNSKIDSLSYYPPKPNGVSHKAHALACTGSVAYSRSDGKFIRSLVYDGGLDFFSIVDGKLNHVKRHAEFDMDYGVIEVNGTSLPVPNKDSQIGYSFIYATPAHFYASFSGANIEDNPEGVANEIHVFDHDGNMVKVILLDNNVGPFAVTDDDKCLYAAIDDDEHLRLNSYNITSDR